MPKSRSLDWRLHKYIPQIPKLLALTEPSSTQPRRTAIPSPNHTVLPCPPYPFIHSAHHTHTHPPSRSLLPSPSAPIALISDHYTSCHPLMTPWLIHLNPLIDPLFRSMSHLHNRPLTASAVTGAQKHIHTPEWETKGLVLLLFGHNQANFSSDPFTFHLFPPLVITCPTRRPMVICNSSPGYGTLICLYNSRRSQSGDLLEQGAKL